MSECNKTYVRVLVRGRDASGVMHDLLDTHCYLDIQSWALRDTAKVYMERLQGAREVSFFLGGSLLYHTRQEPNNAG